MEKENVDFRKLYFHLFGKISGIIESIDLLGDPPKKIVEYIQQWLVDAVQEAEEMYLNEGELPKEE